jgi:cytidylate kinase
VDGPAAAGKSTVARELARRLGFRYLDSGAMYRALTWKALHSGVDLGDPAGLAGLAGRARVELLLDTAGLRVLCDGEDITRQIRSEAVTGSICHLADEPEVRKALIEQQRAFGQRHDLVAEGRDQGTEVFPGAELKFYLDASLRERARRRLKDLMASGCGTTLEAVERRLAERDAQDRSRPMGALRREDDMVLVDSTDLTVDGVVEEMLREVERRHGPSSRS